MPITWTFLDGDLFGPKRLADYLESRLVAALKSLEETDREQVLQDPDALARKLIARHSVHTIQVDFDKLYSTEPSEGRTDGEDQLSIAVPFTGEPELFRRDAGHRSVNGNLNADVVEEGDFSRLVFWVRDRQLTDASIKREIAETRHRLQGAVDWTNQQVDGWNETMSGQVTDAVDRRASHLRRLKGLAGDLTIPIRASHSNPLPIPLVPTQLQQQQLITLSAPQGTPEQQWALEETVYEDVLNKLELFAAAVGRLPATMSGLGENDLRNIALVVLNSNFHLTGARGEVFNGKGKTDILVPWREGNAFIGEFKKWDGPMIVTRGLNQLADYLTWRDTKAAMVLFVYEHNATESLAKAHQAILKHPLTEEALLGPAPERRRNYRLVSPTDRHKRVQFALIPAVIARPLKTPTDGTDTASAQGVR